MKFLVLVLVFFTYSCGKNNTSTPDNRQQSREELRIKEEYVRDTREAERILDDAIYRRVLWQYHGTRWFLHSGRFLFRTRVIDRDTVMMEFN